MRYRAIHPFLLAMFPILNLYVRNMGEVRAEEVIFPILLAITAAAILLVLCRFGCGGWDGAGLVASVLILMFFSYGAIHDAMANVLVELGRYRYLLVGFFQALVITALVWWIRRKSSLQTPERFMNALAIFLMILVSCQFVGKVHANPGKEVLRLFDDKDYQACLASAGTAGHQPDIYYILLDEYARGDIMKEVFQYDNSSFLNDLRRLGFVVVEQSRCNYPVTQLSVASTLNFGYLDGVSSLVGKDFYSYAPLQTLIRQNRLFRFLKLRGYRTVAFQAPYSNLDMKNADIYIRTSAISEFQAHVIAMTPIHIYWTLRGSWISIGDNCRAELLSLFEKLSDIPRLRKKNGPLVVFAYIRAPHLPIVFDEVGNPLDPKTVFHVVGDWNVRSRDEYKRCYVRQAAFISRKVVETVSRIMSASESPIIVIASDHGTAAEVYWDDLGRSNLKERLGVLNAMYLPSNAVKAVAMDHSPVNTFRVILNSCFNISLPLLENRSYFISPERPYDFLPVEISADGQKYSLAPGK